MTRRFQVMLAAAIFSACGLAARETAAQTSANFDLRWHTIDNGGATEVGSASFKLSSTIGQADPGYMASGSFDLEGGFWYVESSTSLCNCPGDLTGDSKVDGDDVQGFVNCLLGGATGCDCADLNNNGGVDTGDVAAFVTVLLCGSGCP